LDITSKSDPMVVLYVDSKIHKSVLVGKT